jgi:eukaryotic-like serine/threonine-protein kinase
MPTQSYSNSGLAMPTPLSTSFLEYVNGVTLAQAIQQDDRIGEPRATALCLHLLSVLAEAHEMAIIHRDIKPSNIMITKDGQAKLTDFGIAYTVGVTRLTVSGVIGTLPYIASELFESGTIKPAADLWSPGATLYHAVEGADHSTARPPGQPRGPSCSTSCPPSLPPAR